jgi:large subunit ribosomal protein L17
MRHHNKNRTFGRSRSQRAALMRGLAISLLEHGKIHTTEAKAKELRPYVERLITKSKEDTVASRRLISSKLGEPQQDIIKKLFGEISKKYADRTGGYTRVIKMGETRAGRREAFIELV